MVFNLNINVHLTMLFICKWGAVSTSLAFGDIIKDKVLKVKSAK